MADSTGKNRLQVFFQPSGRRSMVKLIIVGVLIGLGGVIAFNATMHATSTDEFCISCHEQRDNSLLMLQATRHYNNASGVSTSCSDCHVPREFLPKMIRKLQASREVWAHFQGVINTPEKYAAHAPAMKAREIARIRANDSRECRNCHAVQQMRLPEQSVKAQQYHQAMTSNDKTCIDCHAGIAHDPSKMPGASPANPQVLADVHGVLAENHGKPQGQCATCHASAGEPVDDNLSQENAGCTSCHGGLDTIASREAKGPVSPHQSHFISDIACTTCHSAHKKSTSYCQACHSFDFKLPFGAPWQREEQAIGSDPSLEQEAIASGWREDSDVVVIGSGGAGLSAAVAARNNGARVIVLEKEPVPGGNTKLAAGGMNAAETRAQQKLGIMDHKQTMIDDTMKGGHDLNDPALVEVLATQSAASIDWLTDLGADMSDVGRMGGASVNRSHRPAGGAGVGAHVAQVLWDSAVERGAEIRFNSRAVRILQNNTGEVTGVLVHGTYTGYYTIKTSAVVLASGGFSRNNTLVAKLDQNLEGFKNTNQPGATGDGLEVARLAGAATRDLEYIQAHPTYSPVGGVLVTEAVRGNGAILVNDSGERFVNEITTRDKATAAILAQQRQHAWLVFDDSVRKSLSKIESFIHLGIVKQAATLEALATEIEVPPTALVETVTGYNGYVDSGNDTGFERPDMPRKLLTSPFYAIQITPAVHHTMGGVMINPRTGVIGKSGATIPGLYAAGEATGGVHGSNRLGGNAVSDIITFGRLAGAEAAGYAARQ